MILITDDDGIDSPGLSAAARAAADFGDVLIVVPQVQQTMDYNKHRSSEFTEYDWRPAQETLAYFIKERLLNGRYA